MEDVVHTNQQRIEKVRSVFIAIKELANTLQETRGKDDLIVWTLNGLAAAADEADGSLEAINSFLAKRNALDKVI